jgi:ATP-binding cassette subfamily F protein 3
MSADAGMSTKSSAAAKAPAPKPKRQAREILLALRADVRKCEERIEKLNTMRDRISAKLADPTIYDDVRLGDMEHWQRKYAEVMDGLDRAETLWMAALDRLEKAGG